ncbi:MAG: hypothetical protein HC840_31065 [Leptolyngbyaceae cyanobacterium RM2_2_4]|nr:hypothetical protein [Leptolyngbyaceae cyanobacterium RM2_2_4]
MANRKQVLDKIARNLDSLGIAKVRGADNVVAAGLTIKYLDAVIDKPEGGIDDQTSPFLGIGVANPGKIEIDLGGADLDSLDKLKVLRVAAGHANNIVLKNASTAAINGELPGHPDLLGMGM